MYVTQQKWHIVELQDDWKHVGTFMGVVLWYNFGKYVHYPCHSWNLPQVIKKFDISKEVFLLEKQNWYNRDHLGEIPKMCRQG